MGGVLGRERGSVLWFYVMSLAHRKKNTKINVGGESVVQTNKETSHPHCKNKIADGKKTHFEGPKTKSQAATLKRNRGPLHHTQEEVEVTCSKVRKRGEKGGKEKVAMWGGGEWELQQTESSGSNTAFTTPKTQKIAIFIEGQKKKKEKRS